MAHGGHQISERKIRERCPASLANLIRLMPHAWRMQVFDNSVTVAPGEGVPDPVHVLELVAGRVVYPMTPGQMRDTPEWAKSIVEAAMATGSSPG